jgi:hypothetical protein
MIGIRHADELVGILVVVAVAIFLGVILQAGVLRDWFRPVSHLRILLPEGGAAGLSAGADVEILGTQVGTVRRVVISPNQQMYAEADVDDQARPFIRRDSRALIRRCYGIAGAALGGAVSPRGPRRRPCRLRVEPLSPRSPERVRAPDFCPIRAPSMSYDGPEILPSSTRNFCLTGVDAGHRLVQVRHAGRQSRQLPALPTVPIGSHEYVMRG